ncbi:CKLF-like MARVEL transmembrane domain-containing protein 7 [Anguilla rostrata]|uniref:MARVEL domain-containing protein n=1 Tax=Anguilla anguilla TaxID=7936 RepID=A0A9D3RWZ0_ANGAN|nr:CKLF-like MARVEL transmembrane domain-containing protein 7 [Anguilla anguilla]XP_035285373.1 CKLF-like MARVEL transmembrane domain-containing protein 7 [Anguilla anguilla]KAG5842397.1 hypothetical protein ANANG_G00177230 [Anguilla anguilla]
MSHTIGTPATSPTSDGSIMNFAFTQSLQGMLRIAQVMVLLIAFLLVCCAPDWPEHYAFRFFEVVTLWFFFVLLIFLLMHIFRLHGKVPYINWVLTEFLHYAVGALLIFIASIVAAASSWGLMSLVLGSIFGFIGAILMAISIRKLHKVITGSKQSSSAV